MHGPNVSRRGAPGATTSQPGALADALLKDSCTERLSTGGQTRNIGRLLLPQPTPTEVVRAYTEAR